MLGSLATRAAGLVALSLLAATAPVHAQVSELSWQAISRHAGLSVQVQIEDALARDNPTHAATLLGAAQLANPRSATLRALSLHCQAALGNWEEAYAASRDQLRDDPALVHHVAWTHWAALSAVRAGRTDEAIALLEALTRYPEQQAASAVLLYNLAEMQRLQGDLPSAIVNYQLSLSHSTTYPSALLGLGAALEATGEVEASQLLLRRLATLDPGLVVLDAPRFYLPEGQVHWLRALAREATGDVVEARAALRQLSQSEMASTHATDVITMSARLEARLARAHDGLTWIALPGCTPQRLVVTPAGTHAAVLCQEGQLRTGALDASATWQIATALQHASGGRNLPARTAGIAMPSPERVLVWSTSGEREAVVVTRTGARAQREADAQLTGGMPVAVSPDGTAWAVALQGGTVIEVRPTLDGPVATFFPSGALQGAQVAHSRDRVAVRISDVIETIRVENGSAHTSRWTPVRGESLRAWSLSGDGNLLARAWTGAITVDRTDTATTQRRVAMPAMATGEPLVPTTLAIQSAQTVVVGFREGLLVLPVP